MSISKSVRWRKRRGESNFYSSDSLQLRLCIPSRQEYDICYPWVTSDSCCSDPLFHPERGKDGRTDGGKRWWDWWWKRVFAQVTSRQCSFASRWLGMARWQLFRWYAGDCVGQVHRSGLKKRQKHRKWEAVPSRCGCRSTTTGMGCAHVLSDLQNVHRQKYTFGLVFLHLLSRDWSKVMWVKSWTKN